MDARFRPVSGTPIHDNCAKTSRPAGSELTRTVKTDWPQLVGDARTAGDCAEPVGDELPVAGGGLPFPCVHRFQSLIPILSVMPWSACAFPAAEGRGPGLPESPSRGRHGDGATPRLRRTPHPGAAGLLRRTGRGTRCPMARDRQDAAPARPPPPAARVQKPGTLIC